MKTVITIENGRIEIQVDDGAPVLVKPTISEKPVTDIEQHASITPDTPPAPVAVQEPPAPAVLDERTCEVCGGPIPPGSHRLVKVCSEDCRKRKQREYAAKHYQKKTGKPARQPDSDQDQYGHQHDATPALHEDAPPAKTYTRSKCCEAKVEIRGSDEGTNGYYCLACMNLCDTYEYTPNFTDPWNCNACRIAGRLCRLHHGLESEGKTAPLMRHEV